MEEINLKDLVFKDVEILIQIRSGETEINTLKKLMKALTASSTSLIGDKLVLTEVDMRVHSISKSTVVTLKDNFYID